MNKYPLNTDPLSVEDYLDKLYYPEPCCNEGSKVGALLVKSFWSCSAAIHRKELPVQNSNGEYYNGTSHGIEFIGQGMLEQQSALNANRTGNGFEIDIPNSWQSVSMIFVSQIYCGIIAWALLNDSAICGSQPTFDTRRPFDEYLHKLVCLIPAYNNRGQKEGAESYYKSFGEKFSFSEIVQRYRQWRRESIRIAIARLYQQSRQEQSRIAGQPCPMPVGQLNSMLVGQPYPMFAGQPYPMFAGQPYPMFAGQPYPMFVGQPYPIPAGQPSPIPAGQPYSMPAGQTRPIPAGQTYSMSAGQTRPIPAGQTRPIPAGQTYSMPAG